VTKQKNEDERSSSHHALVQVDLEFPRFQDDLAKLTLERLLQVRACVDNIRKITWAQILATSSKRQKRGLNWEVLNQKTACGSVVASIRVTDKFRARVTRDGVYMRFISLHPDHGSTYKEPGGEAL